MSPLDIVPEISDHQTYIDADVCTHILSTTAVVTAAERVDCLPADLPVVLTQMKLLHMPGTVLAKNKM